MGPLQSCRIKGTVEVNMIGTSVSLLNVFITHELMLNLNGPNLQHQNTFHFHCLLCVLLIIKARIIAMCSINKG